MSGGTPDKGEEEAPREGARGDRAPAAGCVEGPPVVVVGVQARMMEFSGATSLDAERSIHPGR